MKLTATHDFMNIKIHKSGTQLDERVLMLLHKIEDEPHSLEHNL